MKAKETDLMMTSVQMTKSRKPTHHSTANSGKDKEIPKSQKDRKYVLLFQRLLGVSVVGNVALLILLAYLLTLAIRPESPTDVCTHAFCYPSATEVLDKEDVDDMYTDLTLREIHTVIRYFYSQGSVFGLNPSRSPNVSSSILYSIELLTPAKHGVMQYLTESGKKPSREARVVLHHGRERVVEEYVVGPLSNNGSLELLTSRRIVRGVSYPVPYRLRQVTAPELWAIYTVIMEYKSLHDVMRKSFGATLFNCIDEHGQQRCVSMYKSFVPRVYTATRRVWLQFYYDIQFYTLHPIDLQILMDVDINSSKWTIINVWYAQKLYNSYEDFINSYRNGTTNNVNQKFPEYLNTHRPYGSLRPSLSATESTRPPRQIEVDGHRYTVSGQTIKYLKWRFKWVNSLTKGPTLFNVQFGGDRVVYEMGLQDIVTLHTGSSPAFYRAAFAEGFSDLGSKSAGLVPGVDCPGHATFINVTITTKDFHAGGILPNAMCVFEHNLGRPLRRHYSTNQAEGGVFYGGLVASALVLRTIYVINNYDYILDYMFYENGAIEMKIHPTGYILTTYQHPSEQKYGFRFGESTTASMHLHLFHFKIDIDILGTENRYETLDIGVEQFESQNLDGKGTDSNYRYKMQRQLKRTELEAAYVFNFTSPTYHIVYNDKQHNAYGEHRGYRIQADGFVHQVLPRDEGFESTIPWSRYQMAVTRQKVTEENSGSAHATLDAGQPTVDFRSFIADNENIIDQDLVFWLTLGAYHIPKAEDIPNIATSGSAMSILLTPFNYFDEDPSMQSSDSVYITPQNIDDPKQGLNIEQASSKSKYCIPKMFNFNKLKKDGTSIFFPYA